MVRKKTYDTEGLAYFVTFSCYKRRRFLDDKQVRQIVISILASQLAKQNGCCIGFVIMPDHVHAIVWFPENGQLSHFMKQWKQRSSVNIKRFFKQNLNTYFYSFNVSDPIWQARYYSFNLYSEKKIKQKLEYMHNNPVKSKLVIIPTDWVHSSARYYYNGKSVGVDIRWP
jgi:putative transposase